MSTIVTRAYMDYPPITGEDIIVLPSDGPGAKAVVFPERWRDARIKITAEGSGIHYYFCVISLSPSELDDTAITATDNNGFVTEMPVGSCLYLPEGQSETFDLSLLTSDDPLKNPKFVGRGTVEGGYIRIRRTGSRRAGISI